MSTISGVSGSSNAWSNMVAMRSQQQAKMFAKVDADGSGGVDKSELKTMLADVAQKMGATDSATSTDSEAMFTKMDSNGDGSLTSTELDAGMQALMQPPPSTMDFAQAHSGNADGAAGASSASSSSTTYDDLDTNQDGTVSALERMAGNTKTAPLQALLKAMDSDGDSKISSTESDAFIQKLTRQLESLSQSGQSSSESTTGGQASKDSVDFAQLVQRAYEQIANGLAQQAKGSTLSAVAWGDHTGIHGENALKSLPIFNSLLYFM